MLPNTLELPISQPNLLEIRGMSGTVEFNRIVADKSAGGHTPE